MRILSTYERALAALEQPTQRSAEISYPGWCEDRPAEQPVEIERPTAIYRTWIRRLDSGTFTKSECGQWAHAVLPLSEDQSPGGLRTNLRPKEARDLRERMATRGGVALTSEHVAQGVEWICSRAGRKGLPTWAVDGFERFSFQGDGLDNSNGYRTQYTPLWRLHTVDGRAIDYTAWSWQSGKDGVYWRDA